MIGKRYVGEVVWASEEVAQKLSWFDLAYCLIGIISIVVLVVGNQVLADFVISVLIQHNKIRVALVLDVDA